jgi:hypothetical protein
MEPSAYQRVFPLGPTYVFPRTVLDGAISGPGIWELIVTLTQVCALLPDSGAIIFISGMINA